MENALGVPSGMELLADVLYGSDPAVSSYSASENCGQFSCTTDSTEALGSSFAPQAHSRTAARTMARKQETDLTGSASNNKNRRAFCGPYALSYRKGRENASKKVLQAGHAASVSLVCARMRANSA